MVLAFLELLALRALGHADDGGEIRGGDIIVQDKLPVDQAPAHVLQPFTILDDIASLRQSRPEGDDILHILFVREFSARGRIGLANNVCRVFLEMRADVLDGRL